MPFQGCYKDGIDGTRDCRYFAAAYLVVRITVLVLPSIQFKDHTTYFILGAVLFLMLAGSLAIAKSYKDKFSVYNTVDVVFALLLAVLYLSLLWIESTGGAFTLYMYFITGTLPLAYMI